MTDAGKPVEVVVTRTTDPEKQVISIQGLECGYATLNGKGTQWSWYPREVGFAFDLDTLKKLIAALEKLPLPSREHMEMYYRAKGHLGPGEHLGADWGPPVTE